MNEELEILGVVTGRLEGAGIQYMLSGSMALNHYAQPRMTRDMDLVVDLRGPDAVKNLIAAVPDLDWQHIERWAKELDLVELLDEVRT